MRVCNADGFGIMTSGSNSVSAWFDSLVGGEPVGVRRAEDGRLCAVLEDDDCTREEPVDVVPFADVQVGPDGVSPRWRWNAVRRL